MAERRTRIVKPDILRDLMERMLRAAGCEAQAAATAADVFLEADLRGIGLQGLDHLRDPAGRTAADSRGSSARATRS